MKKRLIGKKAQIEHEEYYIFAQLLLIVLIGFALFSFVGSVSKGTLYERNYRSRDIALLMNSLYAGAGDISYSYPYNLSEFNVVIDNNFVKILENNQPISYPYQADLNFEQLNVQLNNPFEINFIKQKTKLDIK